MTQNWIDGLRIVPNETIPADVHPYLLPSEKHVVTVRRHAVVLTPAAGLLVINMTAFTLSAADVIQGGAPLLAGLGILLPVSCYILYRTVRSWLRGYVIVTSARIMLANVACKNPLFIIPLAEARDMTFVHMMLFGRDLGFGSFIFKKSDTLDRALKIRYLPYPEQLYIEVCDLAFKDDQDY